MENGVDNPPHKTHTSDNIHLCSLTSRLTTAANAQPRGPASTTKPQSHNTGDDVQTADIFDQKASKFAAIWHQLNNLLYCYEQEKCFLYIYM